MKFSDKLQKLRKENNYSQEQLADILNISRQAVSKWESGTTYPETDKFIELSRLFNVSIDYMLNDELGEKKTVLETVTEPSKGEVKEFEKFLVSFARGIAFGVALCIFATLLLIYLSTVTESELMVIPFLLIIGIAVSIFIYYGMSFEKYKDFYKLYSMVKHPDKERDIFYKKFTLAIVTGVLLCILSVVPVIASESINMVPEIAVCIMLSLIMIAVILFVYYGIMSLKYNNQSNQNNKIISETNDKISGVIMLSATIIFLIAGFVFDAWHPMWIVFPVGGIMCGIVSTITGK